MTAFAYPTEYEVHAFIDDELSPPRREEIAAILRQDPSLAALVAAYQSDRDLLSAAFSAIDAEPLPAAWAAQIQAAMVSRPRSVITRRYAIAASVALLASVGAAVRWNWPRGNTIVAEAEAARDGQLDGRLAAADPLPPPASRNALLQSTLGMKVRAPDLERYGFRLAAMDLFTRPNGAAAQLRYVDPDRRDLTIYVRPSNGAVQFDILRQGDTRICVWQDDVVGAVIIAQVSDGAMLRIASSAYTDLNL